MLLCIVGGISQKTFCLCFRIRTGTFGSRTVNTVLAIVLQLPLSPVEHFPSLQPFSDSLISLRPPLLHSHFSSLLPPIFFFQTLSPFLHSTYISKERHSYSISLEKTYPPLSLYQPLFSFLIVLHRGRSIPSLTLSKLLHVDLIIEAHIQRLEGGDMFETNTLRQLIFSARAGKHSRLCFPVFSTCLYLGLFC